MLRLMSYKILCWGSWVTKSNVEAHELPSLMLRLMSYQVLCWGSWVTKSNVEEHELPIIIIMVLIPGQFIKRRKLWFWSPRQGRFDILTMMDRECSSLDSSYRRHITFACTGCYQLHPHHRLGIITRDLSPVPIFRPGRMDTLVS